MVPLIHHDVSDLGSLILIQVTKKENAHKVDQGLSIELISQNNNNNLRYYNETPGGELYLPHPLYHGWGMSLCVRLRVDSFFASSRRLSCRTSYLAKSSFEEITFIAYYITGLCRA